MIIQCPYCATSYELDPARLSSKNPMLKCSRCRHVFAAPSGKKRPARAPAPAEKPAPEAEPNLKLPCEAPRWKEEPESPPSNDLKISEPEEDFTLGVEGEPDALAIPEEPIEEAPALNIEHSPREDEDEEPEEEATEDEAPEIEDEEEEEEAEVRRPARRSPRRQSGTIIPVLVFLALVTTTYAALARALFASPALCDRVVGRMPLIGRLGDDRLLTRKVALSDIVGSYQRIKNGKDVFVITGKALNTAPVALHSVQVSGKLYGGNGQALDEKVIYCGNSISAKVLKDLTPNELSILQKVSPPKRFMIEPGESSTFVIVFMDPPRDAAEFSTQVVAAQHQT